MSIDMTGPRQALENCTSEVKRQDPDRYLSSLFTPNDKRQDLHALYAFDNEVRHVPDRVTEPLLGEIRLQWWRDAIADIYEKRDPRPHDTVITLAHAIERHHLPREEFDKLIDARAFDLYDEPMPDWSAFQGYVAGTEVTCLTLTTRILSPNEDTPRDLLQDLGEAWAISNELRRAVSGASTRPRIVPVSSTTNELLARAKDKLASARGRLSGVSSEALPAVLHMCLIEGYLTNTQGEPPQPNMGGLRKRYKLLMNSLIGRI